MKTWDILPTVYIGNFNSHHNLWEYDDNDDNGEKLLGNAEDNNLHLVLSDKDKHTILFRWWGRRSTQILNRASGLSQPAPPRFNRDRCTNFYCAIYTKMNTPRNLTPAIYYRFVGLVLSTAKKHVPRGIHSKLDRRELAAIRGVCSLWRFRKGNFTDIIRFHQTD